MSLLKGRGIRQLYVLLDEADNFVRAELEETSGGKDPRSAVSWFLRDLQTSAYPSRLRFIFAGYDQIGRVFRDPGLGHSAFGNWGEQPLRLGPLDEGAARDLIVQPLTALGMTVGAVPTCPYLGMYSSKTLLSSTATGFRSLAKASAPTRSASSGIEPPPANGSTTSGRVPGSPPSASWATPTRC